MATDTPQIDEVARQAAGLSAEEIDRRLREMNAQARVLRALLREARARERLCREEARDAR
jgi:hypothetical protein